MQVGNWQRLRLSTLAGLALLASSSLAAAQSIPGRPDAKAGAMLANKVCSNCHLTGAGAQIQAQADVPSFKEIANRPDQSAEAIIAGVLLPKHPMPEIQLTRDERDHLAAYILTLRSVD